MTKDVSEWKFHICVVAAGQEAADEIQQTLGALPGAEVEFHSRRITDLDVGFFEKPAPDATILEIATGDATEMQFLSDLMADLPQRTGVLVTAPNASVEEIRQLMRLGVTDFIPQPITRSDLLTSLEDIVRRIASGRNHRPTGKVYTVLAGGGGVGATMLAIQTAGQLVSEGGHWHRVALLDFDLQFGTAALSLDLAPNGGLLKLLESSGRLDAGFLRSAMARHKSGLDVLAAPDSIMPLDMVTPETAEQIVSVARDEYDYVIVDLPRAWTNWTLAVLGASDLVMMVTKLSVSGLERTGRQLRAMSEQGLSAVPSLVVANALEGDWNARKRMKEAEVILGRKVDYCVRTDNKTASIASERGVLVQEVRRRSRIEKDIQMLVRGAKGLLQQQVAPGNVPDQAVPVT